MRREYILATIFFSVFLLEFSWDCFLFLIFFFYNFLGIVCEVSTCLISSAWVETQCINLGEQTDYKIAQRGRKG